MSKNTMNLWTHKDIDESLSQLAVSSLKQKVIWAQLQLAMTGRTPRVKGTTGHPCLWRRTPVKGNHYYLWWIPSGVKGTEALTKEVGERAIFVRNVRHHDETDNELKLGERKDYQRVDVSQLDPRYPDQVKVVGAPIGNNIKIKVVSGRPGSGKTVALQYAACKLRRDSQNVLYVTYTPGLAEQARRFFEVYGVSNRVKVRTFGELESDILAGEERAVTQSRPSQMLDEFDEFLKCKSKQELGPWNDYHRMLWIEIRAYVLGMALPFSWERQGIGQVKPSDEILDKTTYHKIRKDSLDGQAIDTAYAMASQVVKDEHLIKTLFAEQYRARLSLERLREQDDYIIPDFNNLRAIVVDEIQDLTLLQIALLVELSQNAIKKTDDFTFLAAGDESQTVYPSGFDWGMTKDLLTSQLGGVTPSPFSLRRQRRSPHRLAKLIDDTWNLYRRYLPDKGDIPKYGRIEVGDDEIEDGELLRWRLDDDIDWRAVFDEVRKYPNLAFIDLNGMLSNIVDDLPSDYKEIADRVRYKPDSIKGLDRKIVFVMGLDEAITALSDGLTNYQDEGNKVPILQNRNIIDEIRVALSRATHTLVVVERNEAQMADKLNLGEVESVSWPSVQEYLCQQSQDMDAFQEIMDFLQDADESILNEDYQRADGQNEAAIKLLSEVEDPEVERRVTDQHDTIDRGLAKQYLNAAQGHIQRGEYETAEQINQKVKPLLERIDTLTLAEQWQAQESEIELWRQLEEAKGYSQNEEHIQAYKCYKEQISPLLEESAVHNLKQEADSLWRQLQKSLCSIAIQFWEQAEQARKDDDWQATAEGYRWIAQVRSDQKQSANANVFDCLADRYEQLPPYISQSVNRLGELIEFINRYGSVLEQAGNINRNESAQTFASDWVVEVCKAFGHHPELYPKYQEKLRETLIKDTFNFLKDKGEVKETASDASERLREAGQIAEAVDILDLLGGDIPPDLKQVEQFLEDLENLISSDSYHGLSLAEKETVARTLERNAQRVRQELKQNKGTLVSDG